MVAVAERRRLRGFLGTWELKGCIVPSVAIILSNSTLSSIE